MYQRNTHYFNVPSTTFSCVAWHTTALRILVLLVACHFGINIRVNMCVMIILSQHGMALPNSRQGLSVGVIFTTSELVILGQPPTKLQWDDYWMSEIPFLYYFSDECLVEPVATLTVFYDSLELIWCLNLQYMCFCTSHPCLYYFIQQYLVWSYHLILCSIFHGFGIDVVWLFLYCYHDVSVSSTWLHRGFYSLFSADCFFCVSNFTIHIIFLSVGGWGKICLHVIIF